MVLSDAIHDGDKGSRGTLARGSGSWRRVWQSLAQRGRASIAVVASQVPEAICCCCCLYSVD